MENCDCPDIVSLVNLYPAHPPFLQIKNDSDPLNTDHSGRDVSDKNLQGNINPILLLFRCQVPLGLLYTLFIRFLKFEQTVLVCKEVLRI